MTISLLNIRTLALSLMRHVNVPWYITQHGPEHVVRVCRYLELLLPCFRLDYETRQLLRAAALLHDIGQGNFNVSFREVRKCHHIYGRNMAWNLWQMGKLQLDQRQLEIVAELIYRHNLETELPEGPLRLPTLILRAADVLDLTKDRALSNDGGLSCDEIYERMQNEKQNEWPHFSGHLAIDRLRLSWDSDCGLLTFFVEVNDRNEAAFQVARLERKLAGLSEFVGVEVEVLSSGEPSWSPRNEVALAC